MRAVSVQELVEAVDGQLLAGAADEKITSVSTNSKEIKQGALFVPIIGERVDAHKFIPMALEQGAVATFTSQDLEEFQEGKAYIKVKDTVEALQKAASWYRSLFSVKLVGITGSVGKTTTKEMIAAALETKYKVLKTKGNMNSQVGLPLMMFELDDSVEVAVIEMGMSMVGEMSRLAAIAKPDMVVMTNIGVSHIGQLGSKENIRKEKMNIIDQCKEETLVFVNGDDVLLHELVAFSQKAKKGEVVETELFDEATREKLSAIEVKEFGTQAHCVYRGVDSKAQNEGQMFTYVSESGTQEVSLTVLGTHNINNATVALAIAEQLGISPVVAKEGLAAYRPIAMRGQIYEKDGVKVIDDTYNASPDSMKSGVSVLLQMDGVQRRIAVLADVLELGEVSQNCHYEVGTFIGKTKNGTNKVDVLVTLGEEAKYICQGARAEQPEMQIEAFDTKEALIAFLQQNKKSGDAVLVKGSRGMHMEEVVKALCS